MSSDRLSYGVAPIKDGDGQKVGVFKEGNLFAKLTVVRKPNRKKTEDEETGKKPPASSDEDTGSSGSDSSENSSDSSSSSSEDDEEEEENDDKDDDKDKASREKQDDDDKNRERADNKETSRFQIRTAYKRTDSHEEEELGRSKTRPAKTSAAEKPPPGSRGKTSGAKLVEVPKKPKSKTATPPPETKGSPMGSMGFAQKSLLKTLLVVDRAKTPSPSPQNFSPVGSEENKASSPEQPIEWRANPRYSPPSSRNSDDGLRNTDNGLHPGLLPRQAPPHVQMPAPSDYSDYSDYQESLIRPIPVAAALLQQHPQNAGYTSNPSTPVHHIGTPPPPSRSPSQSPPDSRQQPLVTPNRSVSPSPNLSPHHMQSLLRSSDDLHEMSMQPVLVMVPETYKPLQDALLGALSIVNSFIGNGMPLDLQIDNFCQAVEENTIPNKYYVEWIVNEVEATTCALWSYAIVKPYGSYVTGLSLPSSDLDLVIENVEMSDVAGALTSLAESLMMQSWVVPHTVHPISSAKVPVIKMRCLPTPAENENTGPPREVVVDITFTSQGYLPKHTGVDAAAMLLKFFPRFPVLKPLALVLKQFLFSQDLHDTYKGGLSSFCLVIMIVAYLQAHERLKTPGSQPHSVSSLLLGFLDFYGVRFDYKTTGIRVVQAGQEDEGVLRFFQLEHDYHTLFIEDPFDPNNNIGQSVFQMWRIALAFKQGFHTLKFSNQLKMLTQPVMVAMDAPRDSPPHTPVQGMGGQTILMHSPYGQGIAMGGGMVTGPGQGSPGGPSRMGQQYAYPPMMGGAQMHHLAYHPIRYLNHGPPLN